MAGFLLGLINLLVDGFMLLILAHVIMSWFVSPFHPIRLFVDRLVGPILNPIRQRIPASAGGIDFSPMILLIGIQLLGQLLAALVRNLF